MCFPHGKACLTIGLCLAEHLRARNAAKVLQGKGASDHEGKQKVACTPYNLERNTVHSCLKYAAPHGHIVLDRGTHFSVQ